MTRLRTEFKDQWHRDERGARGPIKYPVELAEVQELAESLLHIVPFCEGPNKNLKVLRKKNKKREGFVKEKKFAKFAMPSASQLVAHQSSQI